MTPQERLLHLRAGRAYGREKTCGVKVGHHTEEKAIVMAGRTSEKSGRELEAYPCPFCNNWHIGRKLTPEERERFSETEPW